MKTTSKPIFLLLLSFILFLPVANAAGDWKAKFLSDIDVFLEKMNQKIQATPGVEISEATLAFQLASTMNGLCIGLADTAIDIPSQTVEMSLEIHRELLLGKNPGFDKVKQVGLGCLTAFEESMLESGMTKQDIESIIVPYIQLLMNNMLLQFGIQ